MYFNYLWKLRIVAETSSLGEANGKRTDVGIDDIKLTSAVATTTPETPTTTATTETPPSTPQDETCDFETDLCGYAANHRVQRYQGNAPQPLFGPYSGPSFDHTTGSGYYALCLGSTLTGDYDECTLGKIFTNTRKNVKFSFWYFLYGATIRSVEVRLNGTSVVWSDSVQERAWKRASIDFPVGTFTVKSLLKQWLFMFRDR